MTRAFKYIAKLAAGFFLFHTAAQAQQGVCVYKDSHYEGPRRCFENNIQDFTSLGINDQISSFQIHGNVDIIFYEHRGYRGANKRFSGDHAVLIDGMNDNFSSMKIIESNKQQWGNRGEWGNYEDVGNNNNWNNDSDDNYSYNNDDTGGYDDSNDGNGYNNQQTAKACLFPDQNYGGKPYCFNSDIPRFADFGFDNKADSLRIKGNVEAILYQHENYTGYSRVFRSNIPRFSGEDHDQFSSIRIRQR